MHKLLITFFLCATATATANAANMFTFSNPPGSHAVGVKVIQQYDQTRVYKTRVDLVTGEPVKGERARPIQALVWYPASPERGAKPVTYRDYMETMPTEDTFSLSTTEVKGLTDKRINDNAGARRDVLLREMSQPMHAVRDARAQSGKFPVVVYAPSYSASAIENADLCEYLASHGYVVLSSPSLGAHTRPMTVDLDGAETQAGDIAYLVGYAATLPQADTSKVGVVGFSWGGLANVFAAAKDERIRAIVSLDGSLRGSPEFVDGGKDAARYVTPERVAVPLLYLGARPRTVEELNSNVTPTSYSFMNEMKYSDVYIVTLLPMTHGNFTSYGIRMSPDDSFGDFTRDEISLAHSWAARYTRHFLDAYLKSDAAGLAFMNNTPAANQVPAHMMLTSVRRNQSNLAPTLENYVQQLATKGFDKAIPIYEQMAAHGKMFKLGINESYAWGLQLYRLNRLEQAREIFRLADHLHPNYAFILSALAEMEAKTGQAEQAVKSYRHVVELDPNNADAKAYLKEHASL
jgi:dienelactone hydrolase